MPIYPQQNNTLQNNPSPTDYDLQSEKQRIAEGTEEIKKELLEKWQERYANAQIFPNSLSSMNPELIKFLLSFQNTLFYNDIAKKFSLNQQQRDNLPKIIWYICLNKKWEQMKVSVIDDLSINASTADQIISLLNQNILLKARELSIQSFTSQNTPSVYQKKSVGAKIESITIFDAMKAYPELGEQLITSEKITLKNFPEPVRPSIKNWLADYTFTIGFDNKDSIKRGNYLFHNANTSKLSSGDQQRLAYILKAYDEGAPITVDKSAKKIIFSQEENTNYKTPRVAEQSSLRGRQIPNKTQNTNNPPAGGQNTKPTAEKMRVNPQSSSAMHNTISYSSPQKLPYEKKDTPQGARFSYYQKPSQITPADNVVRLEPKPTPPRELPKNVVNLRD